MRFIVAALAAFVSVSALASPTADAGPSSCDYPDCTPGITPGVVLGAPCDKTDYYVFGTVDYYITFATEPGRLLFCGNARRRETRWFRSPPMAGVKEENSDCSKWPEYYVAQAPDGLFLTCVAQNGHASWVRSDT